MRILFKNEVKFRSNFHQDTFPPTLNYIKYHDNEIFIKKKN